jgi:hypothetical protein
MYIMQRSLLLPLSSGSAARGPLLITLISREFTLQRCGNALAPVERQCLPAVIKHQMMFRFDESPDEYLLTMILIPAVTAF